MDQPEVLDVSVTPPARYNFDDVGGPSPKTATPIRKAWWSAVISRIWEILSEATILIWQILLDVTTLILRRTWSTVADGVVILYRVAYLICEHIIRLILLPSVKWEGAFVISCIAVSLDPLFFYIPIIDETNKCLAVDKILRTTAVVLRLLTDIPLTLHFIAQLCDRVDTDHPNLSDSDSDHSDSDSDSDSSSDSDFETTSCSLKSVKKRTARRMPWLSVSIVINFLAVLPIPQVVIIIGFFRMRGSSSTEVFFQRTILNISLVLQYLPRVCQIYLSSRHFRMGGIWIKPTLNLILYIVAGHVFAAFWYFFAIERVTACWHHVCRNTPGCVATFHCGDNGNTSITITDQLCPINSPNTTVFDFGIYLPILQSGNMGSVNFLRKLFYSLWWGLRNLSNFGTNLETSTYMWENCFAILICISGLLLFLCLIGNVQKYMELATTKSLKSEQSRRKKIAAKKKEIKLWMSTNDVSVMSSNGVSLNMRKRIKKYIKQHHIVEKDIKADVDLKYFLDDDRFATDRIREPLWEYLVKNAAVKSVPMLKRMDQSGWKRLYRYMKPVIYKEKEDIVEKAGEKLVQMIFIIQGEFECTNTMLTHPNHLKKGDCYGSIQIQNWAARNYMRSYYDPLPTSTGRVRCQTKVEAFALRALDFLRFVQQNLNHLKIKSLQLKKLAAADDISSPRQTHNQDDQHSVESWECPKSGLVKLNYSVVWDSVSKKAKMGCVCRDNRGAFKLAGSSCTSPYNDAFLAEASGMAKAIEFCHQNRQNVILQAGMAKAIEFCHQNRQPGIGIVVESDNHDLIDCLNRPLASNERISETLRPILERILDLASNFKPRSFMYCNRQSNTVANRLANHAVDADDPNVSAFLEAPPDWLIPALKEDSPDLYTEHDEEMGRNNDFGETSPDAAANDDEDRYAIMAEESQA